MVIMARMEHGIYFEQARHILLSVEFRDIPFLFGNCF